MSLRSFDLDSPLTPEVSTMNALGSLLLAMVGFAALADVATPESTRVSPNTMAAYRAEVARTGNDADAEVTLALWCERHGLTAERARHLARAVLLRPDHSLARGLLGLMAHQGKWERPESVAAKLKADGELSRKLAEYNARRDDLSRREDAIRPPAVEPGTQTPLDFWQAQRYRRLAVMKLAPEHARLGLWCRSQGLEAEAVAHLTQAVVLDPSREQTWKALDFVRHKGRWVKSDELAGLVEEESAQRRANSQWEPTLRRLRAGLKDSLRRESASSELAGIQDPRVVPQLLEVFGSGNEDEQKEALGVLGRIDDPRSTHAMADLAVASRWPVVRRQATEMLRLRDARDYADALVRLIRSPMTYRVQPVGGPGSPGALLVETPRYRLLRAYDAPPVFQPSNQFYGWAGIDANGLPVIVRGAELDSRMRDLLMTGNSRDVASRTKYATILQRTDRLIAEANLKALNAQQRLEADVLAIEMTNERAAAVNDRVASVLEGAADAPTLPRDEDSWSGWWADKLGMKYEPPPRFAQTSFEVVSQPPPPVLYSCFVAGTLVNTREGRRPIESLRVGDHVLARDPRDGSLSFQPVVVTHHNPPSETRAITLDNGETITSSLFHRFHRVGRGWTMARELATGDLLRTVSGVARIVALRDGEVAPVFNLDVDRARTFFVGKTDVLVHDNRLPDPREKPFDFVDGTVVASSSPPRVEAVPSRVFPTSAPQGKRSP